LSQSNFDRLLQKYLAGECTEEEEKLVLEWYETLIRDSDLHLSRADQSLIEEKLWNAIQTNVQEQSATTGTSPVIPLRGRTWLRVTAAAAVLAVIVTAIVLYRHQTGSRPSPVIARQMPQEFDSLVNATAGIKKLVLADSTLITLQPGAVVYYPSAFEGPAREVYLQGNAFFNVYHNPQKHFKVHLTEGLTTEVLGTSFAITQNKTAHKIEVAVVTGRVLVYRSPQQVNTTPDSTNSVVLTRNKKVTFNAALNQFIAGIVDDPKPLLKTKTPQEAGSRQRDERFNFEEASLQDVLQTLSDAYGILIMPENEQLGTVHFTGDLTKYSLFTQLEYICTSTQTRYEINGSQIIIKGNQTR
jgi:ferric-dicitrate binding protein FerR (iron transport regulator)